MEKDKERMEFVDMFRRMCKESDTTPQKQENKKLTEKLTAYKTELAKLYTKAVNAARTKKVEEYRALLKGDTLTEAERERYMDFVLSPETIDAASLKVDYGDDLDRAAELSMYIQNPDKVERQTEQADFIKRMEGFAERNAPKE